MIFIYHLVTTIFCLLFLSTALVKTFNFNKHFILIGNYHLLRPSLIYPFLILVIIIELYSSYFFMISELSLMNIMIVITLLLIYTFAILVNLIKGNKNINCGCGGVLENDSLNYGIVIRNITLIIIIVTAFLIQKNMDVNQSIFIRVWMFLFSGGLLLIVSIMKEYKNYRLILRFIKKIPE